MANVYFGDGVSALYPIGGPASWTDTRNWYSAPGIQGSCGCAGTAGTPLGHLPATTDNVLVAGFFGPGEGAAIRNANGPPSTPHTGSVQAYSFGYGSPVKFISGLFAGSFAVDPNYLKISGGTYSGAVTVFGKRDNAFPDTANPISGGTFTGTVTPTSGQAFYLGTTITGGNYSPTATLTLNADGTLNPAGFPRDPGFAGSGTATFTPIINISGNVYPGVASVKKGVNFGPTGANYSGTFDILGAGLP